MSTTESPPAPEIEDSIRSQDIEKLDDAIEEIHRKITSGRIRDPVNEKVRIKQWKALAYVVEKKRVLLKDRELEEMSQRLERVEDAQYE